MFSLYAIDNQHGGCSLVAKPSMDTVWSASLPAEQPEIDDFWENIDEEPT
jgi:hypothetical protein